MFRYNGTVAPHEFLIATAWETAYIVRQHGNEVGQAMYFVQDFEPLFMPMGTGYLKAFATYGFGFKTICLGRWVTDRLRRELGIEAKMIPFPLNRTQYHPALRKLRKNKSCFAFCSPFTGETRL